MDLNKETTTRSTGSMSPTTRRQEIDVESEYLQEEGTRTQGPDADEDNYGWINPTLTNGLPMTPNVIRFHQEASRIHAEQQGCLLQQRQQKYAPTSEDMPVSQEASRIQTDQQGFLIQQRQQKYAHTNGNMLEESNGVQAEQQRRLHQQRQQTYSPTSEDMPIFQQASRMQAEQQGFLIQRRQPKYPHTDEHIRIFREANRVQFEQQQFVLEQRQQQPSPTSEDMPIFPEANRVQAEQVRLLLQERRQLLLEQRSLLQAEQQRLLLRQRQQQQQDLPLNSHPTPFAGPSNPVAPTSAAEPADDPINQQQTSTQPDGASADDHQFDLLFRPNAARQRERRRLIKSVMKAYRRLDVYGVVHLAQARNDYPTNTRPPPFTFRPNNEPNALSETPAVLLSVGNTGERPVRGPRYRALKLRRWNDQCYLYVLTIKNGHYAVKWCSDPEYGWHLRAWHGSTIGFATMPSAFPVEGVTYPNQTASFAVDQFDDDDTELPVALGARPEGPIILDDSDAEWINSDVEIEPTAASRRSKRTHNQMINGSVGPAEIDKTPPPPSQPAVAKKPRHTTAPSVKTESAGENKPPASLVPNAASKKREQEIKDLERQIKENSHAARKRLLDSNYQEQSKQLEDEAPNATQSLNDVAAASGERNAMAAVPGDEQEPLDTVGLAVAIRDSIDAGTFDLALFNQVIEQYAGFVIQQQPSRDTQPNVPLSQNAVRNLQSNTQLYFTTVQSAAPAQTSAPAQVATRDTQHATKRGLEDDDNKGSTREKLRRTKLSFSDCRIYGAAISAYSSAENPSDATKFVRCTFEDKTHPQFGHPFVDAYGSLFGFDGLKGGLLLQDCTFIAHHVKGPFIRQPNAGAPPGWTISGGSLRLEHFNGPNEGVATLQGGRVSNFAIQTAFDRPAPAGLHIWTNNQSPVGEGVTVGQGVGWGGPGGP
ncbi:MAG: hypothetical protein Q9168_007847, partial [Polycauliona sp. 1 TL-2023]